VFIPLMLGSLLVVGNMAIQIVMLLFVIRLLLYRMDRMPASNTGLGFQTRSLGVVVLVLFLGHVLQFAVWAWLFLYLGEFEEFATAFYHSAVNFTSLGYGDIVMSERWRLLGGLEAANGVLMFGLSAGAILSIMNRMMLQHLPGRSRLNRGAGNE
jgi:hypothetical protein